MKRVISWVCLGATTIGLLLSDACNAASTPSTQDKAKQIAEVNTLLEQASFKNLGFDFSFVSGRKNEKPGWGSGHMCMNSEPGSPIKASYTPETTPWDSKRTPYHQENVTVSYNGKYWISAVFESGPMNDMHSSKEATITGECPKRWGVSGWDSGLKYFVSHARFYREMTLKEFINDPGNQAFLKITRENDILKISMVMETGMHRSAATSEMWLDLGKGGSLQKNITKTALREDGVWRMIDETTVESYAKVGNMWFPSKAKLIETTMSGQTTLEYSADQFSFAKDSPELYEVALEHGWRVTDQRSNAKYVVGDRSGAPIVPRPVKVGGAP